MADIWWLLLANVLMLAGNLADWWTTERALSVDGTEETNPLVLAMMDAAGRFWVVKKIAMTHAAVLLLGAWMPMTAAVIAMGGALLFGGVAVRNYALYRRKLAEQTR